MTRTVVEQITQAGVPKLRDSGAAPGRYLTRAALAGAFIFVGALLSASAPPGSTTPISLWPNCWGPWPSLPLSPSSSCWAVSCSPAVPWS